MSKKNKVDDVGLSYVKELHFYPARSMSGVEDQVLHAASRDMGENLLKTMSDRADGNSNISQLQLYEMKNQALDLSLALSSAFRADVYRKACNWIVDHKSCFGPTILDVGCDCGIMTCFLARQFPQSRVIGVDICESAVENAKELAERLNIQNVEFVCADIYDIKGTYSTVFSMLVLHELYYLRDISIDFSDDFSKIAKAKSLGFEKASSWIYEHLSDDGYLVTLDKIGILSETDYLALIMSLSCHKLWFIPELYGSPSVRELDENWWLHCGVFRKSEQLEVDYFSEDPLGAYAEYIMSPICDLTLPSYEGMAAKFMIEHKRGDLICGFKATKNDDYVECSIWKHAADPTAILLFVTDNGEKFYCYDWTRLDELIPSVEAMYQTVKNEYGFTIVWEKMNTKQV